MPEHAIPSIFNFLKFLHMPPYPNPPAGGRKYSRRMDTEFGGGKPWSSAYSPTFVLNYITQKKTLHICAGFDYCEHFDFAKGQKSKGQKN